MKRKQVLQSTGYAGCRKNTCIGHEVSLRKFSEPLALKALDFIPVTPQGQETKPERCQRPGCLLAVQATTETQTRLYNSPPAAPRARQSSAPPLP